MSTENNMAKTEKDSLDTKSVPIKGARISKKEQLRMNQSSMRYEQSRTHIGPLPSPTTLEMYNNIDSSFAERIVSMAEQQSKHRQELEKIAVSSGSRDSLLGLIFGLVIGLATIIVGGWLGINGHTVSSSIIGTGGVAGLVAVFVYGTRSRREERKDNTSM